MEYRIERLSANNIAQLKPLFFDVFKQRVSIDFLIRKYDTKIFGAEYIGYFAFDAKNEAAAFYGVIPCQLIFLDKIILAAQSADTMTHPNHRHKGLFTTLAERTYALAREQKISLVFGFPNQNSMPGFRKLGWSFMKDQLQIFTLNTSAIPYARIINKFRFTRYLYQFIIQSFSQAHYSDWNVLNKKHSGVHHDQNFMNYKTYYKSFVTEISGLHVWYRSDGNMKIGAVTGINEMNAPLFLESLRSFAVRLGCSEVIFMTSKRSQLYNALVNSVTAFDAFPIGYLKLTTDTLQIDDMLFEYCDIDIF